MFFGVDYFLEPVCWMFACLDIWFKKWLYWWMNYACCLSKKYIGIFATFWKLEAMVWTCAGEGWWLYWTKGVEYGAAKEKEMTETMIHGCGEGGYVEIVKK